MLNEMARVGLISFGSHSQPFPPIGAHSALGLNHKLPHHTSVFMFEYVAMVHVGRVRIGIILE